MVTVDEHPTPETREKILAASYDLFVKRGIQAVGIDEIINLSGVLKADFYHHFPTRNDLVLAFLDRRQELFTVGYLGSEARRRGDSPHERLLAIFDIFDEWFQDEHFMGCPYIRALVELGADHEIGQASAGYLRSMRTEVEETAVEMGLTDPSDFAECWMILLQGSIVAALGTGYTSPGRVRKLGQLLLGAHAPSSAIVH